MEEIWNEYKRLQEDGSAEANVKLSWLTGILGNNSLAQIYLQRTEDSEEKFASYAKKILPLCQANNFSIANYNRPKHFAELLRLGVTAQYVKGEKVLEVGCGSGELSLLIAMLGHDCYGIDLNPYAIDLCRQKATKYSVPTAKFLTGTLQNLSGYEGQFENVILAEVLEHVEEPKAFIREALRYLKAAGRLIVSVPNGYRIPDPDHRNIFTKSSLEKMMSSLDLDGDMFWVDEIPDKWLLFCLDFEALPVKQEAENYYAQKTQFLPAFGADDLNEPLVSVILPTFNRESYLAESVESIIKQTYKNLELIIVDDASTDSTEQIVREYLKDPRITYLKQETNNGKPAAVNRGLGQANGKYVWLFDDDDIAMPNKLRAQISIMERHPEASLSHTDAIYFDDATGKIINYFQAPQAGGERLEDWLLGCRFHGPSVVMRKKYFEAVGGMDEELIRAQDYDLWIRLLTRYPVAIAINIPTVYFRIHSGARGKAGARIKVDDLGKKTLEYEKGIFKKLYTQIPLKRLFPEIDSYTEHPAVVFECLLKRAYAMAYRGLYQETKADLFDTMKYLGDIAVTEQSSQLLNELIKAVGQWEDKAYAKQVLGIIERIVKALARDEFE